MAANIETRDQVGQGADSYAGLQRRQYRSMLTGMGNMMRKELGDWFGTKRWLGTGLLWVGVINGLLAMILFLLPAVEEAAAAEGSSGLDDPVAVGLQVFFAIGGVMSAIGAIVLSQDEIIGERQSGSAAWILSKPVSRAAFVLSKLAANAVGMTLIFVALPAAVAYAEVSFAAGGPVPALPFVLGLGPLLLSTLFYLALATILGVFFSQRAPVLGISLAVLLGAPLLANFVPQIALVTPTSLPDMGTILALGGTLPTEGLVAIGTTAAWIVLLIAVGVPVFRRQDI